MVLQAQLLFELVQQVQSGFCQLVHVDAIALELGGIAKAIHLPQPFDLFQAAIGFNHQRLGRRAQHFQGLLHHPRRGPRRSITWG